VKLNNEFIENMRTAKGGYTKAQMFIVAYLLKTKISPDNIYPSNWKAKLMRIDVPEIWVSKILQARNYSARDLYRLGVAKCTGLSKETAEKIMPVKTKAEKRRNKRMKNRHGDNAQP
jgi:hypothetical protein